MCWKSPKHGEAHGIARGISGLFHTWQKSITVLFQQPGNVCKQKSPGIPLLHARRALHIAGIPQNPMEGNPRGWERKGGMGRSLSWAIFPPIPSLQQEKNQLSRCLSHFFPECFLLSFFLSVVLADFGNEALLGAPGSQGVFI